MSEGHGLAWVRDRRTVASLLFLATLIVYLPAVLGGTFHFDDMHSIVENSGVRSLGNVPKFFVDPRLWSGEPGNRMYRPTLLVTYALNFACGGYAPSSWLLVNVLVHATAALLVYRLAARLGLSDLACLFAGAVFALHPALSEVQNYVSARSESVAAVLLLCALHVHLTARTAEGPKAVLLTAGAAALSFLAILTKETTALFFAAVALLEIVRNDRRARTWASVGLYAAALVGALALRSALLGHATADVALAGPPKGADPRLGGSMSVLDNVLKVQSRVVVLYCEILLRPVALNVDYAVERLPDWSASAVAALALHAAVVAAAVVALLRGRRLFPLCVGWFWLFLAASVAFPLNVVMNEHRLYLPMIAVALLSGAALARVAELLSDRFASSAKGLALAAAPLACFVPLIVQRSLEWRDDAELWTLAVARAPDSPIAHMHLGAVWHQRANDAPERRERLRLYDAALSEYDVSASRLPGWPDVQLNIGNARFNRGLASHDRADFEKALAAFRRFGEIVGASAPRPRMLEAAALAELGDFDQAVAINRKLASEDSSPTRLYDDQLAHILRRKGDKEGAAAAMTRVVALDKKEDRVDGLLDLGWWCFEDGDRNAAEGYLSQALAISKRTHDLRPALYVARFLHLVGQGDSPTVAEMEKLVRKFGWTAPENEVRWVKGGRTPGVFTGTVGAAPPR